MSPIESIPIRKKIPEPTPQKQICENYQWIYQIYFGKTHVPGDLDPDPSLSDSPSKKSNSSKNKNSNKSVKKKYDRNNNCQKHKKQDASDSSSSGSYLSDDGDNRRKRRKKKSYWKTDQIKLCTRLTAKFPITAYKSKIIRFKLDEDPLQCQIYILTFVE